MSTQDFSNKTCVFVGRFQPFHRGHLMVIQGMAQLCKSVKVVVGSSEQTDTSENPFSFDERREMIQRPLQAEDLIPAQDISILSCSDIPEDDKWIEHLRNQVGGFEAIWTGNEQVKELAEAAGVEVKWIKEVPGISGTAIREMMVNEDMDWKKQVHPETVLYLGTIDGPQRVRNLG